MIPVEYYTIVYNLVLSFVIIIMTLHLFNYTKDEKIAPSILNLKSIVILCVVILFIGLRDPWASSIYFGDTPQYTVMFEEINLIGTKEMKDAGFEVFMKLCSHFLNIQAFYLLCAFLYVIPVYSTLKKWFAEKTFYALAVYVTAMSFWSFGINGLRNGLAASFFIYSLQFVNKKTVMIAIMLLAISFHKSMILPMIAFFATFYLKDTKILIKIWLFAIVIAFFFGDNIDLFIQNIYHSFGFEDVRTATYFTKELDDEESIRSFRFDFILYSGFAIWLGYYYVVKKKYKDTLYTQLLNTYIIANTVWVILIYGIFTNRTAYLSWFIMPLVMIYPLLKANLFKRQYQKIAWMILGSLAFTLLMFLK